MAASMPNINYADVDMDDDESINISLHSMALVPASWEQEVETSPTLSPSELAPSTSSIPTFMLGVLHGQILPNGIHFNNIVLFYCI